MQAEQVTGALERLGEPSHGAQERALQALLVAADARAEALHPLPRRHRRRALRLALLAAMVLLISVVGALAGGLDDLFGGPPAPPAIERLIGQANDTRAFASWASPRVIASKTHRLLRVSTGDGDLVLWVAPTRDGNLCLALQHPGERSLGAACIQPAPSARVVYTVDYANPGYSGKFRSIWGRVPDATRSLELTFADHTTRAVALAHGFFVAQVGHRDPTLLVARDASGRVVARQPVWPGSETKRRGQHLRADGSPSSTIRSQTRVIASERTWSGPVTFFTAPSTYGGECKWISFGTKTSWVWCQTGFDPAIDTELGFVPKGDGGARPVMVFFAALPPSRLSAVRFHFADGTSVLIRARHHWAFYAFPPLTGLRAHRPVAYDLLDPSGRIATHVAFTHASHPEFGLALDRNGEIERWTRDHPGYQPLR